MPTDPLVRYLEKRNRRTFAALVRETRSRVLSAAHRVLGDRALAEDVTQEVYVKLLTVTWRPDEVRCGIALLTTTAVNLARTRLRSEVRRTERERDVAARDGGEGPDDEPDLEAVRLAVAELPDDLRGCVELRYFGGLALREVAEQLGWPMRTTSHRLKRARDLLRERLAPARYAGTLAFVAGLTEDAPGGIEPSATLQEQLARLARDGVACADIAARSPSVARRVLVTAAAVAALVTATWLVGSVAADGVGGEPVPGDPGTPTALADEEPPPPPRPLPSRMRDRERRPDAAEPESSTEGSAPPDAPDDQDSGELAFEIEVVDELGNRLTEGTLDLGLSWFPDREQQTLLAPFRDLEQPQSLRDANPVSVTGLPRGLAGLRLYAQATVPGQPPSDRADFELLAGPPQRIRLVVAQPRSLEIQVIDRVSGEPVRGAHVLSLSELDRRDIDEERAAGTEGPGSSVTRSDGTCVLPGLGAGAHEIEVLCRGYLPGRLVDAKPGGTGKMRLEPAPPEATITTTLRDPAGAPISGVRVLLHLQQSSTKRIVRSDALGDCVFEAVPPGMHRVEVDIEDWSRRSIDEGWPRGGDIAHTAFPRPGPGDQLAVDLGFLAGAGRVVVELVHATGTAAPDVEVRLTGKSGRTATTDRDGRATFTGLPAGEYHCEWTVGAEWSGADSIRVTDADPARVRHVLGSATVRGRAVAVEDGSPLQGARILVMGPAVAWATTDAYGRFELHGASPGAYAVTALADGRAAGESALTILADEHYGETTVRLARGGRVRIDLPGTLDAPWYEVVLVRLAGGSFDTSPDETGAADRITPRVAPGDYVAELRIPGRKSLRAQVRVRDGQDARVRLGTR